MRSGAARSKIACAIVLAFAASAAGAQDRGPGERAEPKTLDAVIVTGTHIRGVDLETEHPLQVLKREDLLRTGLTGIADIVQSLIVANAQTLNRNINNGGSGELLVNLRNLGANRTLVLVNGRRWSSGVDGAVDLSAIPLPLVERIEVLKDGASAIYGSDAIGGVINIITRRDFDGAALDVHAGETDHGDGFSREVDFTFGRGGDRWSASFGLALGKDDPVMAAARRISSVPAPGLPLAATGSSASQYGWFGVPALGGRYVLIPGRPGTSPDDFRRFGFGEDLGYNFVPYNYLRTPQERRAGFGGVRFELAPTLAFTADALFNQRRSAQQLAPPVVSFDADPWKGGFTVSARNAYNPFGATVARVFTRWPDDQPRRFVQTVDTTRLHLGLDGAFSAFDREWEWGVDATRTLSHLHETVFPYADNAKLALAVGPSFFDAGGVARCGTPDAIIAGCVPLDLFTGPGRFTPAMLDYVDVDVSNRRRARSDSLDQHVTGTLAELPAGPLGFAAGIERRLDLGSVDPDPLVATNRTNGTGTNTDATHGGYSVNEAYAELDVPLLAGHPWVRELDVNLATRRSYYAQFGSTQNSRVGLRWKPVGDLLLRSTWSQGFRAPSIAEAYGGAQYGPADVLDLCAVYPGGLYTPSPAIAANCRAHGVPADAPWDFFAVAITGSNPDLKPETSRSVTAGFVYSPSWLPGFDASVDWYRIAIRDAIGNVGPQPVLGSCYRNNDPAACARIVRDPDGALQQVDAINQNLPGGLETEGVDFSLAWRRTTRAGDFSLRWDSAYVDYWGPTDRHERGAVLPDGSLAPGNVAGKANEIHGVVWRWRSVMTLAWRRGAWGASITGRYFSPALEDCSTVTNVAQATDDPSLARLCSDPDRVEEGIPAPRNRVGAVTYADVEAAWYAPWKARLGIGIRNAFNREPPHAWSYSSMNSFFPDYDIPGRFFYARYRQAF